MRPTLVGLLIATTLSSAACQTMRPVALDELGAMQPGLVWVTRADQSVVVVTGPRAFGDTLMGYVDGQFEEMLAADLKQIRMKQRARGKTAALLAAGAVGAAALAYMVFSTGDYRDPAANLDCEDGPEQPGCPGVPP